MILDFYCYLFTEQYGSQGALLICGRPLVPRVYYLGMKRLHAIDVAVNWDLVVTLRDRWGET